MSKETFLFAISLPNKVWTNNLWDKEPCSYFSGIYINPSIILNFFLKMYTSPAMVDSNVGILDLQGSCQMILSYS